MWNKGKKVGNVRWTEEVKKILRKEGNFEKEMKALDKEFDFQNQNIPTEDLISVSWFKALKSFAYGLFRQTSNPEIVVFFNGKTFSLNRYSDTYGEFLKYRPSGENLLEQILLDEVKTENETKQEPDPNWDGGCSEQKEKFEVVEKDFQVIPSPKINFSGYKISSNTPCNQVDPEQITGRPDPKTLPVITGNEVKSFNCSDYCEPNPKPSEEDSKDVLTVISENVDESNDRKVSESVEVGGKFFVKPE